MKEPCFIKENLNSDITNTGRQGAGNTSGLAYFMVREAGSGFYGKYNKHLAKNQKQNTKYRIATRVGTLKKKT